MRCRILILALALLFIFAGHAQATEQTDFLQLLNEYRVENGLDPLLESTLLDEASERHSSDMATYGFFSHISLFSDWFPAGASPWDRTAASGYDFNTFKGENIAAGYSTAASVFGAWKDSPGHDANMLGPNFRVVGIGLVDRPGSEYGWYWTTDFGGYVDETAYDPTLPPGPPPPGPQPPPGPPFSDIPINDGELWNAAEWALLNGIFQGYEDGTFRPHAPVLRRHVALVASRSGLEPPPWIGEYGIATRWDVRTAIPGLTWLEERWTEPLTRSQLLRLMYRARGGIDLIAAMGDRLDAWFAETKVTWNGATRSPRLSGYGELIVQLSRDTGIPVWLALGQGWRESQWGTTGLAIDHNMIWGVKDTSGKYGQLRGTIAGFADYISVAENIRAYYALMSNPDGPYYHRIMAGDIRGALNIYAPAFENNTAQHYRIVMTVRGWCEERGIW